MWEKEREKKLTALKLMQLFVRHIRNVNLLFREDFKSAELLSKTCFFVYFRSVLKMAKETNKGGVESICARLARVTKHASKNLKLIWNDFKQPIMDFFDCIFISTDDLAYLICSHWFHDSRWSLALTEKVFRKSWDLWSWF